ncbi:DUF5677 domain-containing protein [Burkholderia orbicola]|uniref:DUF5677 domain-containing protein n=1 Tax=Burkholderia diffusa TaxID=488732 RepID=UPI001CB572C7|nr:DUF5677 domain-containing protein [Burkholderia diffusa]CAG9262452.1 conserved hypothetical protein [Burkholderia diffusa]
MSNLLRLHNAAQAIVEMFEDTVSNAEVPPDTEWAEFAACLMLTTFEQFHAALHLIDVKLASHAAGPVRSMLEGVAELLNLCADPEYFQTMRYNSARENVALFEEFKKSTGVPDEMTQALAEWDAQDRPTRDELKPEMKKRGDHDLKLADKLKRVELSNVYAMYRVLCAFVHPNLTSLKARHRTGANVVQYRAETQPPVVAMLYRIAVDLLCRCMSETYKFTNLNQGDVDSVVEKAVAMWHKVDPDC